MLVLLKKSVQYCNKYLVVLKNNVILLSRITFKYIFFSADKIWGQDSNPERQIFNPYVPDTACPSADTLHLCW